MTMGDDWVQDLKRWCLAAIRSVAPAKRNLCAEQTEPAAMGYEAAHPCLQAMHWPETGAHVPGPVR
jgi:hypothetical protein